MGNEGVGVHAVHALEQAPPPPGVRLVDGGTGGFHLLASCGRSRRWCWWTPPSTASRPAPSACSGPASPPTSPVLLGAHDIGLRDLLEAASLLGPLPRTHLVAVSIEKLGPPGVELSPAVAAALPEVVRLVRQLAAPPPA